MPRYRLIDSSMSSGSFREFTEPDDAAAIKYAVESTTKYGFRVVSLSEVTGLHSIRRIDIDVPRLPNPDAERDYAVCEVAEDGKHEPEQGPWDPELDKAYLNIQCARCGITTGYPVPNLEEITW